MSDEAKSSDSERSYYEHVRLKSVHERKATPHNLATPNAEDTANHPSTNLADIANAVASEPITPNVGYSEDAIQFFNEYETEQKQKKASTKHKVRISVTDVDFDPSDLQKVANEEEYEDDSDDQQLASFVRSKSANTYPKKQHNLKINAKPHARGVSWGTVTRIELDYAIDSEVAKNTNRNSTNTDDNDANQPSFKQAVSLNLKSQKRKKSIKFSDDSYVRSKNKIKYHRDSKDFLGGFGVKLSILTK